MSADLPVGALSACMKTWFTAAELAGLPEMPITISAVIRMAKREGWLWRSRERGKGCEYHIESLPAAAQSQLRHQAALAAANQVMAAASVEAPPPAESSAVDEAATAPEKDRTHALAAGLRDFQRLPEIKRQRARARQWIIHAIERYQAAQNLSHKAATLAFCADYNRGQIEAPPKVLKVLPQYEGRNGLSLPTVRRWEQAYRAHGLMGLTDAYGNRKGQGKIETHTALKDIILGCVLKTPHITPKKIKQYLAAAHAELNICSAKSIERFVNRWRAEHAQSYTYTTNPDKWKSKFQPSYGSQHAEITRLNQLWELDSTPGDWLLTDGRHMVLGVIDMLSRRLKFLVAKTSKAEAVCSLFRRAVLDWGVPEGARTDNGKDYVSEHFTTVLRELEIAHLLCAPFASEQKGTIERALQTMSHGLLDLLPGFIGHNVAERKVIEARQSFAKRMMTPGETIEVSVTAAELQKRLDQWADKIYAHNAHSGLGMDGKTPFEKAAAWTKAIRRIEDERALDMLLCETAGTRKAPKSTKKGLRLNNYEYIAPELALHQARVACKYDAGDMGRLFVYAAEDSELYAAGEFICVAENPELTGISRHEVAQATKRATRAFLKVQSAEYAGYKRAVKRDVVTAVIEHRIAQSDNVTRLPARSVPYTTPDLQQKGRAARVDEAWKPAPLTTEQQAERARFEAKFYQELEAANVVEHDRDGRKAHLRWVRIGRRIEAGEDVTEDDRRGWAWYRQSVEYRSWERTCADFNTTIEELAGGRQQI